MYITEIVKKLFTNTRHNYSCDAQCLKHILENQVYGLAPTGVLHGITTSYIFGFDSKHNISTHNFVMHDLLSEAKDGTAAIKLAQLFGNGSEMMKFDAVVGNPPYQEEITNRGEQPPIYHYFMDTAYTISDVAVLITPARFLSKAGKTPNSWNTKMLDDPHLKVLVYNQNSSDIFPGTFIEGGVAVTLRNSNEDFGSIGTFATFLELNSILQKVDSKSSKSISDILYSNTSYKYSKLLFSENEQFDSRVSGGSRRYASSAAFDVLPEIFFNSIPSDGGEYIKMLGRQNNERTYKYVQRKYFTDHPSLDRYKVFIPSSNGASGKLNAEDSARVISKPVLGEPGEAATETFITLGSFETKDEADNLLKYVKTKFGRAMLGVLKVTQGNKTKHVWSKVPLQDFAQNSDIDWSRSIPDIDQQLYRKYGLNQEDIDFIETRVKPMS